MYLSTALIAAASLFACSDLPITGPNELTVHGESASGSISGYNYSGGAYGTFAYVDNEQGLVRAGRTAVSGLDCVTEAGVDQKNNVVAADAAPLFRTGLIETRSQSLALADGPAAKTAATIHNLTMFGGLITATMVKAISTTGFSGGSYYTSAAGSSFLNLKVGAVVVGTEVPPNTRIELPGIGTVILNEQVVTQTSEGSRLTVNMIHVIVNQANSLFIPWGTNVFVAHAESGVRTVAGNLEGVAYGSKVDGGVVLLGESALAFMPCNGTDGETLSTEMGAVSYKNVLAFDGVKSTARGMTGATRTEGEMTSTITGVKLLDGRIAADVIVADASALNDNGAVSLSATGSSLVNLRVDGVTIDANAAPNTKIPVANIGTLWIHRVIQGSASIEVRMLELVVEVENSYDLPIGTHIQIAVAKTGIK